MKRAFNFNFRSNKCGEMKRGCELPIPLTQRRRFYLLIFDLQRRYIVLTSKCRFLSPGKSLGIPTISNKLIRDKKIV